MVGRGAPNRGWRPKADEERGLRWLGKEIPFSEKAVRPKSRAVGRYLVVPLVVALVVLVGLQWFRPVGSPQFRPTVAGPFRLPGAKPSLPWPAGGSAALAMEGVGSIGRSGSTAAVPIGGLVKVMTAYVVLHDHPLAPTADGPAIPVTAATLAAYQAELASQQAVVPVADGESLTEREALEGLLVASGNDMAVLLSNWDAGNSANFVAEMNGTARGLGLDATHFADPVGVDPGSVSTPADLIRLAEAAMTIPTFRDLAALPQTTLPLAGTIYSLDYNLGRGGFVGIKVGADTTTGGSDLFEAQRVVAGRTVTLVGVVLGQVTPDPTASALFVAYSLVDAAYAALGAYPVPSTAVVGRLVAPWGASVPVTASQPVDVVGLPGTAVTVTMRTARLPSTVARGATVGVLVVDSGGQRRQVVLRTADPLAGPSPLWRMTRV